MLLLASLFLFISIRVVGPSVALFSPPPENFFGAYPPPSETKKRAGGLANRPALPSPLKEVQTSFLNFL